MENKEPDDDLFDRLNVSGVVLFCFFTGRCLFRGFLCNLSLSAIRALISPISRYNDCSHCPPLDFYSQQAPSGVDGWSDSQSFPYLQCLNHTAAAVEGTYKLYVSTWSEKPNFLCNNKLLLSRVIREKNGIWTALMCLDIWVIFHKGSWLFSVSL